ncbi:MAG: leucine dehydrogenase [Chlamydiae bacterium SM23_39]|nr:MAG: leucine dehydrogenase [Chlamydiae bacterium SM23_39]
MTTIYQKQKNFEIEEIPINGYEKVLKVTNKNTGLKGIIAIHNTFLGPALGGIRIYPYKNFEDALNDVLRLSKGMTYKSAIAEVGLGGGKSVIIADPVKEKNEELLLSFAEVIDSLEGKYIGAEDVGCSTEDVMIIRKKTKYVTGLPHAKSSGNPSVFTAWGTFRGIQSVLKKLFNDVSLKGKKIAVQGIGSVGSHLIPLLFWHGAEIIATDINRKKSEEFKQKYGIKIVEPEQIMEVECDVFSPCAMGGIINSNSISTLKCKAIAGCANNQLLDKSDGELLHEKNILFAPDFIVNGGGLINVSFEITKQGYHPKGPRDKTDKIFDILMSIYEIAEKNDISTSNAAIELAEYKIKYGIGKRMTGIYFHHSF